MVIFTGGKSRAISSPRHLTLRHARRNVFKFRKDRDLTLLGEDDDGPDLEPGEERLNSYWAPSLVAGPQYTITAEQTVKAPTSDDPLLLVSEQPFTVDAPQFALPENSVYSVYPPAGYPEENRMLPHIVLSDPHLPWERIGSPTHEADHDVRNRVPWLVLFTFTQEELKLAPDALKGFGEFKQTGTLSIKTTVGKMRSVTNAASPVNPSAPEFQGVDEKVGEFVFIKRELFRSLFSAFDEKNNRVESDHPETQQYKYFSHVRKINTTGMAIGGTEDVGIFSIVVGNRSGPMHNKTPATVCVHLLSIEGVEDMKFPGTDKDFVSLCSLHSWNYTVMPPNMLNVYDTFTALGRSLSVLRPPEDLIASLQGKDRVSERLAQRLEDGFTLVKYRTATGEPTVAFYRGPFTPTIIPHNPYFDTCSNSGQDFQILDQELGIIDITYSSAWNLGRLLAAGDQSFTAALTRLRSAIHKMAIEEAKRTAIQDAGRETSFRSREDVIRNLKNLVPKLSAIHQPHLREGDGDSEGSDAGSQPGDTASPEHRWFRPVLKKKQYPMLNLDHPVVDANYLPFAIDAALKLSMAKDGTVYDETNSPVSTDWMVVLAFVMDRMFLSGVPAHYLISDPSHLTPESLKFFYIDPNWVDAMIDGALSLGNEKGTDQDRVAIKTAINRFVEYLPPQQKHRPQVPTYGFYLRSDLVTMFPDLKVDTIRPNQEPPAQAPLLRHEIVADGVMLGLFDRVPGSADFSLLTFTQPPHQQCFAVGNSLGYDHLTVNMRKQYTVTKEERKLDPSDSHVPLSPPFELAPTSENNFFLWNTVPKAPTAESGVVSEDDDKHDVPAVEDDLRKIRAPYFAQTQLDWLSDQTKMVPYDDGQGHTIVPFEDNTPNSALFAMQLTDPIYYLEIDLTEDKSPLRPPAAGISSLHEESALAPAAPTTVHDPRLPPERMLRTLHSTKHSVVPKLFPSTGDEDSDSDSEGDQPFSRGAPSETGSVTSAGSTFQPAPLTHAPAQTPHVRSIPRVEMAQQAPPTTTASSSAPSRQPLQSPGDVPARTGDSDPAGPPHYSCQLYSPDEKAVILDADRLRQDLVFSVLVSNRESEYMLKEFDIAIPLGSITYRNRNMLMQTYDGPGASMLSNLRFNVLMQFTRLEDMNLDVLMLRLLPRSSTGYISVKKVFELSFLLCLAKVNAYRNDMRVVTLYTREYYKGEHEAIPIKNQFDVVLQNNNIGG